MSITSKVPDALFKGLSLYLTDIQLLNGLIQNQIYKSKRYFENLSLKYVYIGKAKRKRVKIVRLSF